MPYTWIKFSMPNKQMASLIITIVRTIISYFCANSQLKQAV